MFRVFNMGIGMFLAVDPAGLRDILAALRQAGQRTSIIGSIQPGGEGVVYHLAAVPEAPPSEPSEP